MIIKRQRFEAAAAEMREKNSKLSAAEKSALDKQESFCLGYNAGVSGLVGNRDLCPLSDPSLRAQWKKGFDLGATKGLKLTMPKFGAPR